MAEETKVMQSAESASISTGRKRGRPRKDESRASDSAGRRYQKADQGTHFASIPIGQPVSGVLDGKFDAGYMLTVRVGNTGTILRGVVFEPGRSLPITPANDIAPHLQMVTRAEIPIPADPEVLNQTPIKSRTAVTAAPLAIPAPFANPGDKVPPSPMTGTFVVPVTLTPKLPTWSCSAEVSIAKSEGHPSPTVLPQPPQIETDIQPFPSAGGGPIPIPNSGSADTSGISSAYDSESVPEVQKNDGKNLPLAPPVIADSGPAHQAAMNLSNDEVRPSGTASNDEVRPSGTANSSNQDDLNPTGDGVGNDMA